MSGGPNHGRGGGGLAVYVKDSIDCVRRSDLEVQNLESEWVQINTNGRKILM